MFEKNKDKHFADRPLECTECKKPIAVWYTEIVGNSVTHTCMCADCPELQKRLHGTNPNELVANQTGNAGLECGNCGTKLEEIRRGQRLGCPECYTVFEDILLLEMQNIEHLAPRIQPGKKSIPIHIGRAPGEKMAINPSSRLLALNEALNETLSKEDYEQAAWLRDQIKALTEDEKPKNQNDKTKEKHDKPPGKR